MYCTNQSSRSPNLFYTSNRRMITRSSKTKSTASSETGPQTFPPASPSTMTGYWCECEKLWEDTQKGSVVQHQQTHVQLLALMAL